MPNSHIEIIQPDDGKGETRSFVIICLSVIIVACSLLFIIYHENTELKTKLPNNLNAFAIQVSNFTVELQLLDEAGFIHTYDDIYNLTFPTISNHSFKLLDENCFILHHDIFLFSIEKHENQWISNWAKSDLIQDCHALLNWHELNQ